MGLTRNLGLNLLGHGLPLLGALVAIPELTAGLGPERFGFLALAWVIVGYFGLFDLGIGRALTQMIAARRGAGQDGEIAAVIDAGLGLAGRFAGLAACLALGLAPWLPAWLALTPALHAEAGQALAILALSLLMVIPLAALRGILEAFGAFGLLNALRIPLGLYSYLAPMAVVWFTDDLRALMAVLLLGRGLGTWLHWRAVRRVRAPLPPPVGTAAQWRTRLLGFGGWMTLSNLVAPLLYHLDRFLVSFRVSLAAVGWYAVPADILSRLAVVPGAVMGVFFPAFSHALRAGDGGIRRLFLQAQGLLLGLMAPPLLLLGLYAEPLLAWWLGAEFAARAAPVARWLCLGGLIGALAQPAFHLIQAAGRPRTTALVHLAELGPYVAYLWWLTGRWGIQGAAMAWVLRIGISALVLHAIAWGLLRRPARRCQLGDPG